jgi:hypothetical protein
VRKFAGVDTVAYCKLESKLSGIWELHGASHGFRLDQGQGSGIRDLV